MLEIDVEPAADADDDSIIAAVERACAAEALTQTLRGALRTYPGCTHWHYKNGKAKGTLEITWWPKTRRLWFKIASGRQADWIAPCVERLRVTLSR